MIGHDRTRLTDNLTLKNTSVVEVFFSWFSLGLLAGSFYDCLEGLGLVYSQFGQYFAV